MSHRAELPSPSPAVRPPVPADSTPPATGTGTDSGSGIAAGTGDEVAASTENLVVHRGHAGVLQDITFAIPAGRITGLLGPSGSGKTTLIRALVGVQKITAGNARVLGHAAGDPVLRHQVGYVTQAASVYRDLSVLDNVRYFGAMHGCSRAAALEAVDAVGLGSLAKRAAGNLSGGQFSRVSLACALVAKPELLFLDEPTVGLDPVLRAELWARFAAMAATGTTLVISSHVMEEAGHCDLLLLLRECRLLAQLTPAELRQRGGTDDLELAFLRLIQAGQELTNSPGRRAQSGRRKGTR